MKEIMALVMATVMALGVIAPGTTAIVHGEADPLTVVCTIGMGVTYLLMLIYTTKEAIDK